MCDQNVQDGDFISQPLCFIKKVLNHGRSFYGFYFKELMLIIHNCFQKKQIILEQYQKII